MKLLHIIPHMGGGAGKVLSALAGALKQFPDIDQKIVCFECVNPQSKEWSQKSKIFIYEKTLVEGDTLYQLVMNADIIHLHFWNHPATYHFMFHHAKQPKRVVTWAYVNGMYAPQAITDTVLDFSDIFVTSTPYSADVSALKRRKNTWKKSHLKNIFMTAGIDGFGTVNHKKHKKFTLGYVGTVDSCKMHNNFVELCSRIRIPEMEYLVCGGPEHERLSREVDGRGLAHQVKILGPATDVANILAGVDVFAYPLSPDNYGTGEQVLIEAMAAGVPQIVFGGSPEAYVVQDGLTGIVANSEDKFIAAIHKLYTTPSLRRELAINSKKFAKEHYCLESITTMWLETYSQLIKQPKSICLNKTAKQSSQPLDLFLAALGDSPVAEAYHFFFQQQLPCCKELEKILLDLTPIFHCKTRGTIRHYAAYYTNCPQLRLVTGALYPERKLLL